MGSLNTVATASGSNLEEARLAKGCLTKMSKIKHSDTNRCSEKHCLLSYLELDKTWSSPSLHRRSIVHKGDLLFNQGDVFNNFYQVRSGSFKSYITDISGDWQVTDFHFSGDILGLDGLNSGNHLYTVEALETGSICSLSFDIAERIVSLDRGSFYRHLISALSKSEFRQNHSLMVVSRMHAEQRLANFLLEISRAMRNRSSSGIEFKLTMARYDIANYLGLAVETLSRLFTRLQKEGLIHVQRQYVHILDIEGLKLILSGEHRFSGLQKIA